MNHGFFSDEDKKIFRGDEKKTIRKKSIKEKVVSCETCGLHDKCNSPEMGIQGKGKKKLLIIVEHPTKSDDESGKYLSGKSGKIFRDIFEMHKIDLHNDCWIMGAIQCHCSNPKPVQSQACNRFIQKAMKDLRPKSVLTIGALSINSLVNHKMTGRLSGVRFTDWVGTNIPDQEYTAFIVPTWGQDVLFDNRGEIDKVIHQQLYSHIFRAIKNTETPFYTHNYLSDAIVIKDKDEAFELLHDIMQHKKVVAVDYETTGIKPHAKGHKIFTASISDGLMSFAFQFYDDFMFRKEWKKILQSETCAKILHNAKFEYNWTMHRAGDGDTKGYAIKNILADTMISAHCLDNRKKTNLKFQTYIHFGIAGYDASIDPYLEADPVDVAKYGANAINRIEEAPIDELLKYNALDSLFTYKLWEVQKAYFVPNHTQKGADFFVDSSIELAKAEGAGILLDVENAQKQRIKLTKRMEKCEDAMKASKEMRKWDGSKAFRPSAPGDLTHLLFDCLKFKPNKDDLTPTGKPKGDVEAIEKYDSEVAQFVLKWRKLKKVRDTYLNGFIKEAVDGVIHTSINLHTVDTFRSSSNDPNLQNVPARDAEVMNLLRTLILARPQHKLGEYDYKAMEAVVIACYNKDPKWISYVSNVNNDMHRDMAAKLVLKDKKDITKDERQIAKNGFVFPTVYTSYWKNTAKNMWDMYGEDTLAHLKSKGIRNLEDYRAHVKKVEQWFWHDQFPVGYEWMNKAVHDYEKKGYVDLLTGFRCKAPMTRSQVINTPIQGTASHCKLWTLNQMSKWLTKKKMNSRILLEIHDSIIPDIDPAEEQLVDYKMWLYGTQKIREHWDWLIVPLFIEKKISEVGGNWANMTNMGLLKGDFLEAFYERWNGRSPKALQYGKV